MNWTYNCALDYPIGHNFVYSDLSFILLAEISERVTKKPINVYAKELFESMGMYNSTYLPNLEKELQYFSNILIYYLYNDPGSLGRQ